MAVYQGYRPVLPGQNRNDMTHAYKNELGTYSNWATFSSVHLLDEAPLNDVTPGAGKFAGAPRLSQEFTGAFQYSPMELKKYAHGGQRAAYLRGDAKLYNGVPSASIMGGAYGHDGTREFNYSNFRQLGGLGVSDPLEGAGKAQAAYGATFPNMGPTTPYIFQGVGTDVVADPGETLEARRAASRYGYEQVRTFQGVPSANALGV